MSFTHLKLHSQSQSLVVSGESGAGKTETNKHLMSYLIWRAGTAFSSARPGEKEVSQDLAKDIIDTNPVLEAFGNAKTIRTRAAPCLFPSL
jgi:myosin heavy subunit